MNLTLLQPRITKSRVSRLIPWLNAPTRPHSAETELLAENCRTSFGCMVRELHGDAADGPTVQQVYPSLRVLPENHQRFHLQFATPMVPDDAEEHLELRGENNRLIENAFQRTRAVDWNGDGNRLTLRLNMRRLLHGPHARNHKTHGLRFGTKYSLIIRSGWRSCSDQRLICDHRREFAVGSPFTQQLNVQDWRISIPQRRSFQSLLVEFPTPMDRSLVERDLEVRSGDGSLVPGLVHLFNAERTWSFEPAFTWAAGHYVLIVRTSLTDFVGNPFHLPIQMNGKSGFNRYPAGRVAATQWQYDSRQDQFTYPWSS